MFGNVERAPPLVTSGPLLAVLEADEIADQFSLKEEDRSWELFVNPIALTCT